MTYTIFPRSFDLELQVQRVDFIYRQSMTAPLINLGFTAIFLFFGWNLIDRSFLISWAVVVNFTSLLRIVALWQWRKRAPGLRNRAELDRWHAYIVFAIAVASCCIGLMGWMAAFYFSPLRSICILAMVIGVVSASVSVYAPSLACSLAMLIPSTLPVSVAFFWLGGTENTVMGGLFGFYVLVNLRLAKNWSAYANRSIGLNSELRKKEERLRLARDSSGAVDWEWTLINDAFSFEGTLDQVFGISGNSLQGHRTNYLERVVPQDRDRLTSAMDLAVETGELDTEHQVIWPDGKVYDVAVKGRVQFDQNFKPVSMVGICWNITNKKVEEKIRHERDLYETANNAKLMFLANASHEIRTPLAAINGFAELALRTGPHSTALQEDLQVILRNGKYLSSIVNDLLDISKTESGQIYIQKNSISTINEINDSVLVLQSLAQEKKLSLDVIYETKVPVFIVSDATRFRQVMINVLSNAVKYTETGGVTVRISFDPKRIPSQLRVVVSDTGIGISAETKSNLFQAFARGQNRKTQRVPGSGLGLALSRSLARKMGGDLRLLNTNDGEGGSSFEITFDVGPLGNLHLVEGHYAKFDVREIAEQKYKIKGMRVLLAEDDPDLSLFMQRFLTAQGVSVDSVEDGAQAIDLAMRITYDVILMDIMMPVMDGYNATTELRERGYRKPIIALTAHASRADQQNCYRVGCDSYLSKPIDTRHLLEVLAKYFDREEPRKRFEPPHRVFHADT